MHPAGREFTVKEALIKEIYRALKQENGFQNWWPGDSPFEIAAGAILTQNTSWTGVEKAISNLKDAGLLSAEKLLAADPETIASLIRPSGYFNLKTARLRALCEFLTQHDAADLSNLAELETPELRSRLLELKGVGRETADSIILYAVGKPIFVVDAYTRRIFSRLGLVKPDTAYDEIQIFFEENLSPDLDIYRDYHAQIVCCAKQYCQTKPKCLKCPLSRMCPYQENGDGVERAGN